MLVLILWVHHHHLWLQVLELSLNSWVNRLKFFRDRFFLVFYHFDQGIKLSLDYLPLGFNMLYNSCLNRIECFENIVSLRTTYESFFNQILNGPGLANSFLQVGCHTFFHDIQRLSRSLNSLISGLNNNLIESIAWPNDIHHKFLQIN